MLQLIQGLPSHVVGVKATGEVTADDLKAVLIPALEKVVEQHGHIHYLLQLDTDVKNWTFGAWMQDAKAGLQNFTKWKKIAVVSDEKAVEKFTDVFSYLTPGESKGFKPEELEQAKTWVATES